MIWRIFLLWACQADIWSLAAGAKSNVNWEVQRYDGWYNNLAHHSLGSAGSKFLRLIPATYADGVYQVAEEPQLPNPRILSDVVMKGESGSESPRNLTVLALFFGYHVLSEISSTEMPACPAEFLNIPIPAGDSVFNNKNASNMVLPFQRSKWFPETGRSPNNPRDQINSVTTWIDGSSIYGSSHSWSDALRHFSAGKLASGSDDLFPKYANKSLPMWQLPNPSTGERGDRGLYGFGNAFGNESPFLQAESIVWFRFHNYMSNRFADTHKDWSDEDLFQHARKWVIAIYQNIAFYEWLPAFLSRNVSNYEGYKQFVDSSISPEFVTLMAQMLQTMMPPGVYMRNNKCDFQNVTGSDGRAWPAFRMCNNYWSRENTNLQTAIKIDELLLGMASQIAEKEDKTVVEDLRDYWYGSMKYSRTDLSAASIQRARDQGLSTYNNMRKYYGLKPKEKWEDIGNQGKELLQNLASLYENDIERLELIPGVMLEINGGPSEIVSNILLDQFHRLRDGDRFWFENEKNGLFTKEEIIWIQSITFQDVLVNVTSENNFQQDVFTWKTGDPCPQPEQLKSQNLEKCVPFTITDYFEGSGAGFGVTILALCCLPLVSLIIACAVAKSGKNNFKKYQKKNKDTAFSNASVTQGFQASEWCGPKEPVQLVWIQLHPIQMLKVVNTRQNESRMINLQNQPRVEVLLSNTHGSKVLLLKIPKEYDLVLFFKNEDDRDVFVQQFKHFLGASNIPPSFSHLKEQEILANAFTKKQRHEILETFFKQSLSHVLDINKADAGDIDRHKIKDALNYEISREEFAESLGLNPQAHFVESMFCFADRDRNGYLSFEEFCHILLTLIKGTAEDKLKFIFSMHDTNGNGILPKEELHRMLRSFSDITKFLTQDQTENVIQSMFNEAGFPSKEEITWDDFYSLFKDHSTILSETRPLTKGGKVSVLQKNISFINRSNQGNSNRKQLIDGTDLTSICTVELEAQGLRKRINKSVNGYQLNKPTVYSEARRETYHSSKIRQKIQQFKRLIENYRRHIVCLVIFYGISAGLFVERSYYYGFASPSTGIADTTYVGLIISRGSAATISFMFSYILLTMCRNVITFLRETFLNHYIPFDAAVDFHRLIAMSALILTIFHTVGHLVNVYIFTITPLSILSCLFPATFANDGSEYPKKFYWWFFETVPGMTGVLLLAIMALMYVFSTFHFRRVSFRGFWLVHQLYVLFYILTIMHGSFALIQFPKFHIFFIPPAIIFVIDKLISLSRKKIEINVVQGEQFPSGVVHLKFQRPSTFDYKSGQWVRIACLALGTDEYHPFTLTSAPHEETLSLHIRAVGPWTTRLRELYSTQNMAEMIQAKLYLDGPFGEGHQEWNHFEVSVLVGGGIGVTPFASILKDLVFKSSVNLRIRCKKIYFIWVTRTQRQFEWLTDIIREVENNDRRELVSVHIYITQLAEKFDFRTTMLYICERHFQKIKDKSLLTGLRSITHFGRPPFVDFFNSLQDVHPEVKKFGVFSCGPPGMTKNVENACQQVNKRDEGYFVHHYENF